MLASTMAVSASFNPSYSYVAREHCWSAAVNSQGLPPLEIAREQNDHAGF